MLPLNLMRQPFRKEALPGSWAWSLLLTHRPSLVVNMELFSQTKHGPSLEVARHSVWCAQTFWLLDWTARPGSVFPLLYFTNVCVFLPAPLGKPPCFMVTCHWQGISHQDWNLWPSPELPALLSFRALGQGRLSLKRTMALGSSIVLPSEPWWIKTCPQLPKGD
jgi:hypothetical protein